MEKHKMPFIGRCSRGYLGIVFSWGAVRSAEGDVDEAYRGFHLSPFDLGGKPALWSSRNPECVLTYEQIQALTLLADTE